MELFFLFSPCSFCLLVSLYFISYYSIGIHFIGDFHNSQGTFRLCLNCTSERKLENSSTRQLSLTELYMSGTVESKSGGWAGGGQE